MRKTVYIMAIPADRDTVGEKTNLSLKLDVIVRTKVTGQILIDIDCINVDWCNRVSDGIFRGRDIVWGSFSV